MEDTQKDLNNGTETTETGHSETVDAKASELAELQERLRKTEEERDNYKTGLLKYKKTERTLEVKKDEQDQQDEQTDWDEDSKKFQAQTLSRAEKAAQKAAESVYQKSNEKQAINMFLENHPEFQGDEDWQEIMSNYHPKNGKDSVSGIMKDLERARVSVLYEKGELERLSKEAEERGKRKGQAEAYHANAFASAGGTSKSSSDQGSDEVSKGAKEIANLFGIDPKRLN